MCVCRLWWKLKQLESTHQLGGVYDHSFSGFKPNDWDRPRMTGYWSFLFSKAQFDHSMTSNEGNWTSSLWLLRTFHLSSKGDLLLWAVGRKQRKPVNHKVEDILAVSPLVACVPCLLPERADYRAAEFVGFKLNDQQCDGGGCFLLMWKGAFHPVILVPTLLLPVHCKDAAFISDNVPKQPKGRQEEDAHMEFNASIFLAEDVSLPGHRVQHVNCPKGSWGRGSALHGS